jgi:hypothetical protein
MALPIAVMALPLFPRAPLPERKSARRRTLGECYLRIGAAAISSPCLLPSRTDGPLIGRATSKQHTVKPRFEPASIGFWRSPCDVPVRTHQDNGAGASPIGLRDFAAGIVNQAIRAGLKALLTGDDLQDDEIVSKTFAGGRFAGARRLVDGAKRDQPPVRANLTANCGRSLIAAPPAFDVRGAVAGLRPRMGDTAEPTRFCILRKRTAAIAALKRAAPGQNPSLNGAQAHCGQGDPPAKRAPALAPKSTLVQAAVARSIRSTVGRRSAS